MPEIASYGQETLVLLMGLVWSLTLPVGMEISQGSCEMIRALLQGCGAQGVETAWKSD